MIAAAVVVLSLLLLYCLVLAAACWYRRGRNRLDRLVAETHVEPAHGYPLETFAALNPRYQFRRYPPDAQLVTRIFPSPPVSSAADDRR